MGAVSLRVLSPGRLLQLDKTSFWKLVRERPWLGVGLLERLGRRLSSSLDVATDPRPVDEPPPLFGERF